MLRIQAHSLLRIRAHTGTVGSATLSVPPARMPKRKNLVGLNVRMLRRKGELSQAALAARCQRQGWDIDRFTVARIEAGTRWVGDFEVVELAKALRVSLLRLYG